MAPLATATVREAAEAVTTRSHLIYFSSTSENTKRFVQKLGRDAARIPLYAQDAPLQALEPFVLVLPTYGGTNGEGSVPKQVIRFLNDPRNRKLIRGVLLEQGTPISRITTAQRGTSSPSSARCRIFTNLNSWGRRKTFNGSTKGWKSFGHNCRRNRSNRGALWTRSRSRCLRLSRAWVITSSTPC